jgi:DNA repair protein RecN (Recombination protein N)
LEIEKQKLDITEIAKQLSKNRSSVLSSFTNIVEQKVRPLGMENAKMEVKMKMVEFDSYGMDHISFYFAANKGSELKPMKEVASGGEMSRLTLVIKSIITEAINLPTMIFDEIDTGISGEVARKMAAILNELSYKHQVVSITHSPQIASTAHKHFFVFKEDKGNRTASAIKTLKKEERIIEIAKMLSGDPPSKTALENAKEMIEG